MGWGPEMDLYTQIWVPELIRPIIPQSITSLPPNLIRLSDLVTTNYLFGMSERLRKLPLAEFFDTLAQGVLKQLTSFSSLSPN